MLYYIFQLVDPETLEDVVDPNVNGELWITAPTLVKVNIYCPNNRLLFYY